MFFFSPDLRVSDADREATVDFLKKHYAAGRLTDRELSQRVDAAYRADYESKLARLTNDLPPLPAANPGAGPRRPLLGGLAGGAVALAIGGVAVLAIVPAEVWAPLLALMLPIVVMLVFAIGPLALPLIAFAWFVRALGGPRYPERAHLRRPGGMGTFAMWQPLEMRRRY